MKKVLLASVAAGVLSLAAAGSAIAQCDPDYSGVTLTAGAQTGPLIASAAQAAGQEWTKKTCGRVDVVEFPFGALYPKYLSAMVAGEAAFDVIPLAPAWTPDFAPYLAEMPAPIPETDAWMDIAEASRHRTPGWDGHH